MINRNATNKRYYRSNLRVKIAHIFRVALRKFIIGEYKPKKLLKDCGVSTYDEIMRHLINTIPTGYSITDYGKLLCVDHIKSCKYFNLTNRTQRRKCFNIKNLRLVTKSANIDKENYEKQTIDKKYKKSMRSTKKGKVIYIKRF